MTAAADHTPSRGCYQRGCRRPECCDANYRYGKTLQVEHFRGQRRLHDTTQVRAHIERLIANNWWQAEIARAAGVSRSTVSIIIAGQSHTNRRIALAILSVPITPMLRTDRGERVDATGSIRRLRALATLGHTWTYVCKRTGITIDRLGFIARGKTEDVRPYEAQRIAAAYRTLSTLAGDSKQVATGARNKGWHGPLSWDGIDNPDSKPETSRRSRAKDGARKVYVDPARVAELTAAGRSAQQIADELGCHKRTVTRARGKAEMAAAA